MWKSQYQMVTDVPGDALFCAIADVNHWSAWDVGLESTRIDGAVKPGAAFVLKPRGGPKVRALIDDVRSHRLVDTAHLFGAKMRATHEYVQVGPRTTIYFGIEVWGPLGFVWRKIIGENQIKGAPAQLEAFINHGRGASASK